MIIKTIVMTYKKLIKSEYVHICTHTHKVYTHTNTHAEYGCFLVKHRHT